MLRIVIFQKAFFAHDQHGVIGFDHICNNISCYNCLERKIVMDDKAARKLKLNDEHALKRVG